MTIGNKFYNKYQLAAYEKKNFYMKLRKLVKKNIKKKWFVKNCFTKNKINFTKNKINESSSVVINKNFYLANNDKLLFKSFKNKNFYLLQYELASKKNKLLKKND